MWGTPAKCNGPLSIAHKPPRFESFKPQLEQHSKPVRRMSQVRITIVESCPELSAKLAP